MYISYVDIIHADKVLVYLLEYGGTPLYVKQKIDNVMKDPWSKLQIVEIL